MKQTILQRALSIRELEVTLENISSDDKRPIESYTDEEILAEAEYVLDCFYEGGHTSHDELYGVYGPEAQQSARKQVKDLNSLLNF